MTVPTLMFEDAEPKTEPLDSVPMSDDIEHPCETCGRETGWSGRGRKKRFCDVCKPKPSTRSTGPRVTGKASDMAAQAAKVLSSVNSMMALGMGGVGYVKTMEAAFDANEDFEKTVYNALLTNPKLCNQILSVGQFSSGIGLGMGYLQFGMAIAPAFMMEYRLRKEAREVAMGV